MMFASELFNYAIKFVALFAIAIIGGVCGAKFKKSKIEKKQKENE